MSDFRIHKTKAWLGLFLVLGLWSSCRERYDKSIPAAPRETFNLAAFVEYQDSVLQGNALLKVVGYGDLQDTLSFDEADWQIELQPLNDTEFDAYLRLGKLKLDKSPAKTGNGVVLELSTIDPESSPQLSARIFCSSPDCAYSAVDSLWVEERVNNPLVEQTSTLLWTGKALFSKTYTDMLALKPRSFALEVTALDAN